MNVFRTSGFPAATILALAFFAQSELVKAQEDGASARRPKIGLVLSGGALKVVTTSNAETPLTGPDKPLACVDGWEHAYSIDHRNARPTFLEVFCDKLINWDVVAQNL